MVRLAKPHPLLAYGLIRCVYLCCLFCIFSFHATMCAVSALNPQRFRGFGPCDPHLLDLLKQQQLQQHEEGGCESSSIIPPNFIDTPLHSLTSFSEIDSLYLLSAEAVRQEVDMSAQIYGSSRLRCILKTQQVQMQEYQGPLILSQRGLKANSSKRKLES